MPKILYIPSGTFLTHYAYPSKKENGIVTNETLTLILDFVRNNRPIDKSWAAYFNILLPLLESELEIIPD